MTVRWIHRAAAFVLLVCTLGCTGATSYRPRIVARHELTLAYADGLEIYAGKKKLTDAPSFDGLSSYVHCVPKALEHADKAERDGGTATALSITSIVLGAGSLGGLSGLAYVEDEPATAYALLGTGIAAAVVGFSLALVSRSNKNQANGHAVDAVNFYNDAVGSRGKRCP